MIKIETVKKWREDIDATHIVVFAVGRDGSQHVATHGETEQDAKDAAVAGNKLKTVLNWPDALCRDEPLERICKNCTFYKPYYGIHCFNGWTDDGSKGHCHYDRSRIDVSADEKCRDFQPKG